MASFASATSSSDIGWDASFEALVARVAADYGTTTTPANASGLWIAEIDGVQVGCAFCANL